METIVIIILMIAFFVYLVAQDSKKETRKERYGEAIGKLATSAADSVAGAAFRLTESADKKKIRLAEKALADRNGRIYRIRNYERIEKRIQEYLKVDEYFKKQLELLGLTPQKWQQLAMQLYHMGVIIQESRDSFDYSKKHNKRYREYTFSEANKYGHERRDQLRASLEYLNIPVKEWIEYGETVLDMHNLYDTPEMKKYGYKTAIMPMTDNFHLL